MFNPFPVSDLVPFYPMLLADSEVIRRDIGYLVNNILCVKLRHKSREFSAVPVQLICNEIPVNRPSADINRIRHTDALERYWRPVFRASRLRRYVDRQVPTDEDREICRGVKDVDEQLMLFHINTERPSAKTEQGR